MSSAYQMVRRAASWYPSELAIVDGYTGESVSYERLLSDIEEVAAKIGCLSLEAGSNVSVYAEKSIAAIVLILALDKAGMVTAMINPRLKSQQVLELARQTSSRVLFVDAELDEASKIAEASERTVALNGKLPRAKSLYELPKAKTAAPDRLKEDAEFIFFTSGTTSQPKAVVIPEKATEPRVLFMSTQIGHVTGRHNRIAGILPIFHVIGFYAVLLQSLSFGGTYFLYRIFEPKKIIEDLSRNKITSIFITPTHASMILEAGLMPADGLSLKHVLLAGATLDAALMQRLRRIVPCPVTNIYGTTEAMNSLYSRNTEKPGRMLPSFFNEVRVARTKSTDDEACADGEEGELCVSLSSSAMFTKYLNDESANKKKMVGGWYRTGDAAVRRSDHTIEIMGRIDDTIISGAENIHPHEVEEVIYGHPSVKEVTVLGLPDSIWGQIVAAVVVCKSEDLSKEELESFVRTSSLANFKRPRRWFLVSEIPKNNLGKPDRRALKERLS